jgi:pSer/pThr/pTyr-binding forkhead associated (FHA) protein
MEAFVSNQLPQMNLVIQAGPQVGQIFQLRSGAQTIGRAPDNQIVVPDSTISKQHVQITVQPEGVWIQDLGSSNGTFVNGQRITESTWLKPGDSVQVGSSVVLGVQVAGAVEPVQAASSSTNWLMGGLVFAVVLLALLAIALGAWFMLGRDTSSTQSTPLPPPTAAQEFTPAATTEPAPEVAISFTANKTTVQLGECATLRWQVSNAKEVRLDGEQVAATGSRQVCPQEETEVYRLTALSPDGETKEETVVLTVQPTPLPPPGVDIEFSADDTTVGYGSCTNLRWDVKNAQAVRLDGEKVGLQGAREVCPTEPATTYQLLIDPLEGEIVEQTVIINVPSTPTPTPTPTSTPQPQSAVIDKFTADQTTVTQGGCTTLRWTVRNAQSVQLSGGDVGSQGVSSQGARQVCPSGTGATYTLAASSSGSTVQASVTVSVSAPPTPSGQYSLAANPNPAGDCTTLSWHIEGVKEAYLNGGQFNNFGLIGPTGQTQACGSGAVVYVMNVVLLNDSHDSRSVTVTFTGGGGGGGSVGGGPSVDFSHDGTFLRWSVRNANEAFIDCYDTDGHHVAGGQLFSDDGSDLPPTAHGRCTLTAIGHDGSTTTKTVTF